MKAVVVGAGHNGLVAACYLARAGVDVEVVERDTVIGGAVSTVERWPGYRVDRGSSAHIMVRHTGIIEDLDLDVTYQDLDPWGFAPFGNDSITFHVDLDKTCTSIEKACGTRDADAYRAFVTDWSARNLKVFDAFQGPPTPARLGRAIWGAGKGTGLSGVELSRQYLQMRQEAGAGTVPALSGLADTELAAGQAEAAVRTGQALVAQLEGTREEQELAHARLNLCAAFLALDQLQPAWRTATLGWKTAERFGMQAWWADYLALLAALDGRPQAAALLLGFADATYERTQDHREPNEAAAAARVRQHLGASQREDDTAALLAAGALLPEAAVAALALEPSSR